ncbi:hypothetical protein L4X63_02900 [Geomonas sp. Red32]|uniref:hypothetical protein n=1 Tax=Geomonas sp. Red32 TaxID=2912856 RepID=UPI00202CCBAC|nr:hypothetical protein [Geomonas sp. Red32]MCM0080530.1 hypothetical protein [Geomonas sp. Red32]
MIAKGTFCAAVIFLLSACTTIETRTTQDSNLAYSEHHYAAHDLKVDWKSEQAGPDLRIKGTVTNPRYDTSYNGFELTASLLDASGKAFAKKVFLFYPGPLTGTQQFGLDFPQTEAQQLQKIKFRYEFNVGEGGDHFTGNFESVP